MGHGASNFALRIWKSEIPNPQSELQFVLPFHVQDEFVGAFPGGDPESTFAFDAGKLTCPFIGRPGAVANLRLSVSMALKAAKH